MVIFDINKSRDFSIENGQVIIADPYYMGYDNATNVKLDSILDNVDDRNSPFVFLPNGLLYYNLAPNGISRSGRFDVFSDGEYLFLENLDFPNARKTSRRKEKTFTFGGRKITTQHRFGLYTNLCALIVGDSNLYRLPEEQWEGTDGFSAIEDFIREQHSRNLVNINNGRYGSSFDPQKYLLTIYPL